MNTYEEGNRTVAIVDILGFSSKLEKWPLKNIGAAMEDFLLQTPAFVKEWIRKFPATYSDDCLQYTFSDSIIIISKDDTEKSCKSVIYYVKRLMHFLILGQCMPRGAITFGEMYINKELQIFIGKPLVRANHLEKEQEWIGAIIDKSVETQFPQLFDEPFEYSETHGIKAKYYKYEEYVRYSIPFKENSKCKQEIYYAINLLDESPVINFSLGLMCDAKNMYDYTLYLSVTNEKSLCYRTTKMQEDGFIRAGVHDADISEEAFTQIINAIELGRLKDITENNGKALLNLILKRGDTNFIDENPVSLEKMIIQDKENILKDPMNVSQSSIIKKHDNTLKFFDYVNSIIEKLDSGSGIRSHCENDLYSEQA